MKLKTIKKQIDKLPAKDYLKLWADMTKTLAKSVPEEEVKKTLGFRKK